VIEVVEALPLEKGRGSLPAGKTINPLHKKIRQRKY
jgi:hypothetical protein